jgi:hypothetical protein
VTPLSVRLVDESGPKGATALICRIKVVLDPTSDVIVEHEHGDLRTAIDGAVDRAEVRRPNSAQTLRTSMEAMDAGGSGGQKSGRRFRKTLKRRPSSFHS